MYYLGGRYPEKILRCASEKDLRQETIEDSIVNFVFTTSSRSSSSDPEQQLNTLQCFEGHAAVVPPAVKLSLSIPEAFRRFTHHKDLEATMSK